MVGRVVRPLGAGGLLETEEGARLLVDPSLAAQVGYSHLEPPVFSFSSLGDIVGDAAKEDMEMFHRYCSVMIIIMLSKHTPSSEVSNIT